MVQRSMSLQARVVFPPVCGLQKKRRYGSHLGNGSRLGEKIDCRVNESNFNPPSLAQDSSSYCTPLIHVYNATNVVEKTCTHIPHVWQLCRRSVCANNSRQALARGAAAANCTYSFREGLASLIIPTKRSGLVIGTSNSPSDHYYLKNG